MKILEKEIKVVIELNEHDIRRLQSIIEIARLEITRAVIAKEEYVAGGMEVMEARVALTKIETITDL